MFATLFAIGATAIGGYGIANINAKNSTTWGGVWWKGFVVSLCFAGVSTVTYSLPRCLEYDNPFPPRTCIQVDTEPQTFIAEESAQRILFNTVVGGSIGMSLLARNLKKEGTSIEEYV